jgi:hypothetical protein
MLVVAQGDSECIQYAAAFYIIPVDRHNDHMRWIRTVAG